MEYFLLVVLAAVIWIGVDAANLGVRRGSLGGGFLDMGIAAWVLSCLLFWYVGIPCYLATRPRHVQRRRAEQMALAGGLTSAMHGHAAHPSWAPDPRFGAPAPDPRFVAPTADPRFGTPPLQPGAQTVLPSTPDGGR